MSEPLGLLAQHGALGLFLIVLAARLGAPIPAAPVVMLVGAFTGARAQDLCALLAALVLANVLGHGVWFIAGKRFGHRVLRLLCRVSLSPDICVSQSESMITRWGGGAVLAGKFLPGISVVAAPMAGALGMSTARFLVFDVVGSLLWSGLYLFVGAALGEQVQAAIDALADAGLAATAVLAIVLLGWIAMRLRHRRATARSLREPRLGVAALQARIDAGKAPLIIDVRQPTATAQDQRHLPGAIFVSLDQMPAYSQDLPRDRDIVVYCNCPADASAARAAQVLRKHGVHRVHVLAGGLDAWTAATRPIGASPAHVGA